VDTFKWKVELEVEVQAFNESDAWDALQDEFAVGEQMGFKVTACEFKEIRGTKRK
jgi:hypothetical protein